VKTDRIPVLRPSIRLIMCARAATAPSCSGFTIGQIRVIIGACPPSAAAAARPIAPTAGTSTMAMSASGRSRPALCSGRCRSMGWQCGFYPPSHQGRHYDGTAETFEQARAEFEAAWREYLPKCTEVDFEEYRRQEAWTAWKYAVHDAHLKLPTQSTSGRARCFCGAPIDIPGTATHVYAAHMMSPLHA
jgi:hypothetical protein